MKIFFFGFVLAVVIIFGYQNCYQPRKTDSPLITQYNAIKLVDENIQKINFLNTENVSVEKNSKTFTLVSQVYYSLDYTTGKIIQSSNANNEQAQFCISNSLLLELKNIINSSNVCKKELSPDNSRVCNQLYQPGFAVLVTNRDDFDLGSSSDGCGSVQINLCEKSSEDMLKGWFQAVRTQLTQFDCAK